MRSAALRYSIYVACVFLTAVVARALTSGGATDPGGDPDGAALEAIPVMLAAGLVLVLLVAVELGTLWAVHQRKRHQHSQ